MKPTEKFLAWLNEHPSPWRIGQLVVERSGLSEGKFAVFHVDDDGKEDVVRESHWQVARRWVKLSREGEYRPLKAEGNLSRGWRLEGIDFAGLVEALNVFYPTAVANWALHEEGRLRVTPFEETAGRQTGMYRVVRMANGGDVSAASAELCEKRCLKVRLWKGALVEKTAESEIPLLCPEVCGLFMAEVRSRVKSGSGGETSEV